ncbi:hypothetical protein [Kutzneria kofuensis]|uniref:hypothetical protein n=1 Tax=Kutzneria kofuensis TaxID=103725 RepID=UPI0031E97C3C
MTRRVGDLRRTYTGETDSTLRATVTAGMTALTPPDRATILTTLNSGYETRLLGENPGPPVEEHIRRTVLADTTDPAQQQLEAGILLALGQIGPYQWPATAVVAPMPVCFMVRPVLDDTHHTAHTVLHLRPATATPMITTLLPRIVDDHVHGLPGLRVRLCRRHVELYLIDSGEDVSVSLASTSYRQWAAMLAFARTLTGRHWQPAFQDPLTTPEQTAIAAGRVPGPVPVASALLRRLRVLGDTVWLTIRVDGPTGLRVQWAGGRTAAQVAAALVHPLTGVPGERFTATRDTDDSVTVTVWETTPEPTATVNLRQASLTAPPPFTRIDATDAWEAFDHALALPHPVSPRPAAFTR